MNKDKEDMWINGVIGGIANHYNIDPLVLRLLTIFIFFGTPFPIGWIYILLMIIMR